MTALLHQLSLSAPLFLLVLVGYGLSRFAGWPKDVGDALSRFVFGAALPAMLFHLMSGVSKLPPVDARLLIAFFGGCLAVFVIGRLVAWKAFGLDGVAQSVFALGGVFSNNVLLGLPIARLTLGEAAVPSVALVLVFNSLTLWTLVTVSVEWARHGEFSLQGFARTARGVLRNPIVAAILSGTAFGFTGLALPAFLDSTLGMVSDTAAPLALIALGMGLAQYRLREGVAMAGAISTLKLVVQPLVVWGLALALGLPPLETQVVVLLASIAVGVNVYLMANQFGTLQGPVAGSLLLSTAFSALTTPMLMALTSG
ncbi:MAG: AEC family transporter [Thauera phenolivorans]|uniref:AEC family transporter n=1 Tax=Thauera phenolivorans TaxID=1792543 RepID=A0A7X7LUS8_9RHOO|nr:AEC family transporter [Thauera phenolivorans]NLF53776.1 AEC family transporter [Thauera phenolivorans]